MIYILTESVSVTLVAPVVSALVIAIGILFRQLLKEKKDKSNLEEEFRKQQHDIDKTFTETIHGLEKDFRDEIKKLLEENYKNDVKIVEALTRINENNTYVIKEISEMRIAMNDIHIKGSTSRSRKNTNK